MSRTRYKVIDSKEPHFFTLTVVNWTPLFSSQAIVAILLESLKFLENEGSLTIYAYVILENHLHLVASGDELGKTIGRFKSYTARQIIDYLKEQNAKNVLRTLGYYKMQHKSDRNYQLWQEGSHPKMVQGEVMMRQKIDYIHFNPVKRGYVDEPVHWRYSSARNYEGLDGLLDVKTDWA